MIRTPLPPEALDATDRAILNALQEGFPLVPRPFAAIFDICGKSVPSRVLVHFLT